MAVGTVGVVLAGGKSGGFGLKKLVCKISGKPAIARIVDSFRGAGITEVYVSTTREYREHLKAIVDANGIIVDSSSARHLPGPFRGLSSVAREVYSPSYLVVPGDMPWLESKVLSELVRHAKSYQAQVASPCWSQGLVELTVMYVLHDSIKLAEKACIIRREVCKLSDIHRASGKTLLVGVGLLTNNPHALFSISTPADLKRPRARGKPTTAVIKLEGDHTSYFWRATLALLDSHSRARRAFASSTYELESRIYYSKGANNLAHHALLDALHFSDGRKRRPIEEAIERLEREMEWK